MSHRLRGNFTKYRQGWYWLNGFTRDQGWYSAHAGVLSVTVAGKGGEPVWRKNKGLWFVTIERDGTVRGQEHLPRGFKRLADAKKYAVREVLWELEQMKKAWRTL